MTLHIYYAIEPNFSDNEIPLDTIKETHRFIGSFPGDENDLDEAYTFYQGENWSPKGQARDLIMFLGLHHTSMSIGDYIETDDGMIFQCMFTGWNRIM